MTFLEYLGGRCCSQVMDGTSVLKNGIGRIFEMLGFQWQS